MLSVELIVLDASCLINLYATGRFRDIAEALPFRLAVAEYVATHEALFVWRTVDQTEERARVVLRPLIEDGLIEILDLASSEEQTTFVDLAAQVDDGEAVTWALAFHRGFAVATDDRKARRVFVETSMVVPLFSTSELLKAWADEISIPVSDLRDVLLAVQTSASYIPGRNDPLYEWWLATISTA